MVASTQRTEIDPFLILIHSRVGIFSILLFHSGEQGNFYISKIGRVRGEIIVLIKIREIYLSIRCIQSPKTLIP